MKVTSVKMDASIFVLWLLMCCTLLCRSEDTLEKFPEGHTPLSDELTLSSGYFHTCVVERRPGVDFGGPLKCWGQDERGQASPPHGMFTQVSGGQFFSCAVGVNDDIACWGNITEPPKGVFDRVSSGQSHACGLLNNGTIQCWGRNDFGESDSPNFSFVQVNVRQLHEEFLCSFEYRNF